MATTVSTTPTWKFVWGDEFDGKAGTSPDPTKWGYETGGTGWGNNELEFYTDRTENIYLTGDGYLAIKAIKEPYQGKQYTSGRLITLGKFEQTYGRFEASIKIPKGQGMWPAFWMLGSNKAQVGWPNCGEIDIMENIGKEPKTIHGSMHGPGYSGGNPLTGTYKMSLFSCAILADKFHTYAVEWEPNVVRFYFDGKLYQTKTPANCPKGTKWIFDHPMYILLNVAVGGTWPGSPNNTTSFPQTMLIDFVRVFEQVK